MGHLIEDKNCYVSPAQRDVLISLVTHPVIENSFFLTGGTALAVFYLHHRLSNDLDFFTLSTLNLGEIDFWVKRMWPLDTVKIKESPNFLSYLIKEIKVDFVIDPISNKGDREKFSFKNGHFLSVDTIDNIVSNKFCAMVSRTEPKDFIDFYFINKVFNEIKMDDVYNTARLKDAIFDDPPTVGFQLEEGLSFLNKNTEIIPKTFKEFDPNSFFRFYKEIIKWVYGKMKI